MQIAAILASCLGRAEQLPAIHREKRDDAGYGHSPSVYSLAYCPLGVSPASSHAGDQKHQVKAGAVDQIAVHAFCLPQRLAAGAPAVAVVEAAAAAALS